MDVILKDAELDAVKHFSKLYEGGTRHFQGDDPANLGIVSLTRQNYIPVFSLLETCGAFEKASYDLDGNFYLEVGPKILLIARQVEANEAAAKDGKDMVESIKLTFKRHPVTAWAFIIFTFITAGSVAVHNVIEVLRDFGIVAKK